MKSDEDIIRDVIQNHLLQVLSLVAMEAPSDIRKAESVTSEKVKLLDSIRVVRPEHVVLGQCGDEKEKAPTFATVVLYVDNPRWSGVRGVVFERSVRAQCSCAVFERGAREFESYCSLQHAPRCQKYSNNNNSLYFLELSHSQCNRSSFTKYLTTNTGTVHHQGRTRYGSKKDRCSTSTQRRTRCRTYVW